MKLLVWNPEPYTPITFIFLSLIEYSLFQPPEIENMASLLSTIQASITTLNESVNQVIANQAQLQTMMHQLEGNQERIMGKMSFGSLPMTTVVKLPSVPTLSTHNHVATNPTELTNTDTIGATNTHSENNLQSPNQTYTENATNSSNITNEDVDDTVAYQTGGSSDDTMENSDTLAVVEVVAEQLVRYLTHKNKMDIFDSVLTVLFEKNNRPACMLRLLSLLFTRDEMADTWYGNAKKRAKKALDPERIALVKDITLIRFPPKVEEGEIRKKILFNMTTRIRNKCRFIRNDVRRVVKTEKDG